MTMREQINAANPNNIADLLRAIQLGDVLRGQLPQVLRNVQPVPDPSVDPSCHALQLPKKARTTSVMHVYARAGAGVPGKLLLGRPGMISSGQFAAAPNGDIATCATDAWTSVDAYYIPEPGDVFTMTSAVVDNVMIIPSTQLAVLLLDATVTDGASPGPKVISGPDTMGLWTPPQPGQACLNASKTAVVFADGEATHATVTLLVASKADLAALLDSDGTPTPTRPNPPYIPEPEPEPEPEPA